MMRNCLLGSLRAPLGLKHHRHFIYLRRCARRHMQPPSHGQSCVGNRFISSLPSPSGGPCVTGDEPTVGVFSGQHVKEFPVRAAIDIGTGGVVSLCIARVDAAHGALRDMMYQTQLPLCLEATMKEGNGGGEGDFPAQPFTNAPPSRPFTLSRCTCADIRNKMTTLSGAMRRDAYEGLSERAAVVSWPLCLAENAEQLAMDLTREFKIDVRVLGKTFHVKWPFESQEKMTSTSGEGHETESPEACNKTVCKSSGAVVEEERDEDEGEDHNSLRRLVQRATVEKLRQRQRSQAGEAQEKENHYHSAETKGIDASVAVSARAQLEQLAFLAHASLSRCVVPQRLLVIDEDAQMGLRIFGTDTSAAEDVHDILSTAASASPEEKVEIYKKAMMYCDGGGGGQAVGEELAPSGAVLAPGHAHGLVEFRVPVDVAQAHRHCVVDIQRRDAASYSLHGSSPNPMLASEWAALCTMLERLITPTLPTWVRRKSGLGGVIAGTSFNGGMLNLAARVAQRMPISLDHLEVHAQHHFCGLTDVLLSSNFPNPLLVMPSTALAAALMRALQTPRVSYLPELNLAAALLTQPSLWIYERRRGVREVLARYEYHQSLNHRSFPRPHIKHNPTAAPNAVWKPQQRF